jgi:hypothetical protein
MESESSEAPEAIAKKNFCADLAELAIERAADYPLPSESIQLGPSRSAAGASCGSRYWLTVTPKPPIHHRHEVKGNHHGCMRTST